MCDRHVLIQSVVWLGLVATASAQPPPDAPAPVYARRWFYAATNLQVDRGAEELIAPIGRAGKAGFNGLMLADYKLNVLARVPADTSRTFARSAPPRRPPVSRSSPPSSPSVTRPACSRTIQSSPRACPLGASGSS